MVGRVRLLLTAVKVRARHGECPQNRCVRPNRHFLFSPSSHLAW